MTLTEYQVFWIRTARQDLEKIIEQIAADRQIQARKVYLEIKEKAAGIRLFPIQGRIVPELRYMVW